MRTLLKRAICFLGDSFYNAFFYYYIHMRCMVFPPPLNIKKPVTFNDKIIYLKTKVKYPNAYIYVDKLLVRDYVADVVGSQYLVPLFGVYKSSKEINYNLLPNEFVIKTNHGSAMNIIVHDKRRLNIKNTNSMLDNWLKINYFNLGRDYCYKDINPCILAEEMLRSEDGGELKDYKIFCFSGKPKIIQVDIDRHIDHTRNFYDLEWNRLPFTILYPTYKGHIQKPDVLEEMLWVATRLSKKFIFARIDLYVEKSKIYFGEITLHHGGGFEPILPKKYGKIIGDLINLDAKL